MSANSEIYDRTVNRAAMVRLYEKDTNEKIAADIGEYHNRLIKEIPANSGKGKKYLDDLIKAESEAAYARIYSTSSRSLLDFVTDQISYTSQTLSYKIGRIWKVQEPQKRIGEEIVLKRPIYKDTTLLAGWANIGLAERRRLEVIIRKSIAEGWDEGRIALALRKASALKITRNQSIGLARTAMTSVQAQADQEVYAANKQALRGYQYIAVLDKRTSDICASRDGKIFDVDDVANLPPAHFYCRSTTVPVVKSYDELSKLEGISYIRKRNFEKLTPAQREFYDGMAAKQETYGQWLRRQPQEIQLRHLGDLNKVEMFQRGELLLEQFDDNGRKLTLKELRQMTDDGAVVPTDTMRFAYAKQKLDAIKLGASRPEDFFNDPELIKNLKQYYQLQAGELDGLLSYTNYRGALIHTKRAMRQRVLNSPPTEEQLRFNPITKQYEDIRLYQPMPAVLSNNLRLVRESDKLLDQDKEFIEKFIDSLEGSMGVNHRAVIADNLRITLTRYRENKEPWQNVKAVLNGQMKFDVMNVSDYMETQLRRDANVLARLQSQEFYDTVLGSASLQELGDNLVDNIQAMRSWENRVAPKIGRQLRNILDRKIPPKLWIRLDDGDLAVFYEKFAKRLALADTPDRDQFAVQLGRDLYILANRRGSRREWFNTGLKLLEDAKDKGFYELETFGVQKRRMRSRNGRRYFGPYYDTQAWNIRVVDKRILKYAELTRKVEVGFRVPVTNDKNRLYVRPGYKTYFDRKNRDTGIPILSKEEAAHFPVSAIDQEMADALNWASESQWKVDKDYLEFIQKLLFFKDDRGNAAYYDSLNHYRKHITARGDTYERFKAMQYLAEKDAAFSNHSFIDHRGRIYERGFIGAQAGETFRPFLNTARSKKFSPEEWRNLQDQIGSFVGGLSDTLEGRHNSLTVLGRQRIAEKWRPEMVKIGNHMLRGKPNDIRAVLDSPLLHEIDGEEQGKFLRLAMEVAKIDNFLEGNYSKKNLVKLKEYDISLALEQDASSSGAQIIALTTRNKELAELSNVVPTNQKKRLYDEIAASTYNDPRFRALNEKLGLTEKDLRKAAKAQNMVTFYGAGVRTGILNVENKLAKVLGKDSNRLVVKAAERDTVLGEISARIARYEKFDEETAADLRALRKEVKDVFDKGLPPGADLMEQLYFLDPKTRDLVERMTRQYDNIVTPDDFAVIAGIMSEKLAMQVPILKDFTRFFGRLAEDFLTTAKPKEADFDWKAISKRKFLGARTKGTRVKDRLPRVLYEALGLPANGELRELMLQRFGWWNPNGTFADLLFGVRESEFRRTGRKLEKNILDVYPIYESKILYPNKLPKSWTQLPWVNFDGKVLEQRYTQTWEERLAYKNPDGTWTINMVQVAQKTEPTWWEEFINKSGTSNDVVDATKARTAYAVNGNHSNDATFVKRFHLWGKKKDVTTATVHDAFFTNAADLLESKQALREMYANALESNVVKKTLDEMLARGLSKELYDKYLEEAIEKGLIPVPGKSRVGTRLLKESDILRREDILQQIPPDFTSNRSWYGIGG